MRLFWRKLIGCLRVTDSPTGPAPFCCRRARGAFRSSLAACSTSEAHVKRRKWQRSRSQRLGLSYYGYHTQPRARGFILRMKVRRTRRGYYYSSYYYKANKMYLFRDRPLRHADLISLTSFICLLTSLILHKDFFFYYYCSSKVLFFFYCSSKLC